MKFLCTALGALFASVHADQPDPKLLQQHGISKAVAFKQGEDMKMTDQQKHCFFDKNATGCTGSGMRTGFDKSVAQWSQYYNGDSQTYLIPMLVNTESYPASYRKEAWKNFLWAKNHFAEYTNIELLFIDEFEKENFFTEGFLAPFYGGSCWSYVGDVSGVYGWHSTGQKMDIGWCHQVPGSIVHETMHALGFVHEHSRPDRDNYLNVNSQDTVNCGKYREGQLDLSDLPYDFGSIMHYGEGACGISVKRQFRNKKIGQRVQFSASDIKGINDLYGKTGPKFARDG